MDLIGHVIFRFTDLNLKFALIVERISSKENLHVFK